MADKIERLYRKVYRLPDQLEAAYRKVEIYEKEARELGLTDLIRTADHAPRYEPGSQLPFARCPTDCRYRPRPPKEQDQR